MDDTGKFIPGNNLFVYLPHFCNPAFFYDQDFNFVLEEYYYITTFNIPLTNDLHNEEYDKLVIFRTIDREHKQCEIYQAKKNNGPTT